MVPRDKATGRPSRHTDGMRVHISVDMEGVAGIATLDQVVRGGGGYGRAQALMTAEANAAVRGAFDGGATHVVVSDSHGTMDNLLHSELDPRATLVFGEPRASCMVQGLTTQDDLVVLLGYHAPAGCAGVLAHTFSTNFTELRVNGVASSEAEVNALYASALGVAIGVLTGDDQVCRLADEAFPGVRTVPVKQAQGWSAAATLSPAVAGERIAEAVRAAVAAPVAPMSVPADLVLEVDFTVPVMADLAICVPGTRRLAGRTVQRRVETADELLMLVTAWYHLAAGAAQRLSSVALRR